MRHDCVLAPQLERMSERNYGAGAEEGDADETKDLTTKDTKEHKGRSGKISPLINTDNTDRKNQNLYHRGQQRTRRKNPERSFDRHWMRAIGAQLNCRRSDQKAAM